MDRSMKCIKVLMFIFNFIFWLSGLGLIILGAFIYASYGRYFSYAEHKFAQAEFFIIAVGVIVFIIGFLGCCGAIKEHICMISTFGVLLIIIFILEVAAGVVGYTYRQQVSKVASGALDRAVNNYFSEEGAMTMLDWAQDTLGCCGNNGPKDYDVNHNSTCGPPGAGVPSCHEESKCDKYLYKIGCHEKFIRFIKANLAVIGSVAIVTALIQVVGIVFSFCLVKAIKDGYEKVE